MLQIDIYTIFLSYTAIYIVNVLLIGTLYVQIRKRFPKSLLILLSFIMSASGNILLLFRNSLTEWIPIVFGNTLVVFSTVVLLIGFESFVNKKGIQIQNYVLIIVFSLVQYYFTFIQPDLSIRDLNISITYVLLSPQIAWLMLVRAPIKIRKITRKIGYLFLVLFVIQIARLIINIFKEQQATHYFNSDNYEGGGS